MEKSHSRSSGITEVPQAYSILTETSQNNTLEARLRESEENAMNQSQTPKIQKVIFLLRDNNDFNKYYEPKVVSLGPIHHGQPNYQLGENYKRLLTNEFIKGSGKSMQDSYQKIKEKINELRTCFEKETEDYDDEALTSILFVDGYAILQYIYCATNDKFKELNIKTDSVAFGQQDLFLLENQLPYCLLKWLMSMSSSEKEKELRKSIETYIDWHVMVPEVQQSNWLSWKLCRRSKPQEAQSAKEESHDEEKPQAQAQAPFETGGIHLKRGNNSYLSNISFTKQFLFRGQLHLPPIVVDDSTRPKFLNLIAYEMCLDFKNDFGVTSYISFLDSLIDEANDVKMLRKARILRNVLGSDEEVAKLFNEIGTDLVPVTYIMLWALGPARLLIQHTCTCTTLYLYHTHMSLILRH